TLLIPEYNKTRHNKKGESGATGSGLSIRNRSRRSAMAASGKPPSSSATKPFNFSDDSVPKRVVLSPDQQRFCLEALKVFKDKRFSAPEKIRQEFMTLQNNKKSVKIVFIDALRH
ncbi:tyrosine protein phosphatase 1, partial [Datura stramonium]|nr:tyrosine protein phosphatase 1 [Datura stramonium]